MATDFTNEFLCPPRHYRRAIYKADPETCERLSYLYLNRCRPSEERDLFLPGQEMELEYEELIEKVLGPEE